MEALRLYRSLIQRDPYFVPAYVQLADLLGVLLDNPGPGADFGQHVGEAVEQLRRTIRH